MTRQNPSKWLLVLLAFMLMGLLQACNNVDILNVTENSNPQNSGHAEDKDVPIPMEDPPFFQEELALLWERSNHDEWDILTAVIDPTTTTTVSGTPESWPDGYEFKATFTRGCTSDSEPFVFTLMVPTLRDNNPNPAIYKLEPHGMEFGIPVQMEFCQPPWEEEKEAYGLFHLWHTIQPIAVNPDNGDIEQVVDPQRIYCISDWQKIFPRDGENLRHGLRFETTHFSRWGLSNGHGVEDFIIDPDPYPPEIHRQ